MPSSPCPLVGCVCPSGLRDVFRWTQGPRSAVTCVSKLAQIGGEGRNFRSGNSVPSRCPQEVLDVPPRLPEPPGALS